MASVRVPINPDALRWAREVARLDPEALARAAGVSAARLAEFEAGNLEPTYNQATALAKKLDRTIPFLMVPPPEVPDVPQTVDFRDRGYGDGEMPDSLARELKRAQEHREAFLELTGDLRETLRTPVTRDNAAAIAEDFRKTLGLTLNFVPPETQRSQVFNFWRGLLEGAGYLVLQTTGIKLSVFRGLSVEHTPLPIIMVNGADSPLARVFTMFHEVAHLANRTSGLCALKEGVYEEAVCNRFAAHFLMPENVVRSLLEADIDGQEAIARISARFRVTLLAAAVRLKNLDLITEGELQQVRCESEESWRRQQQVQREKEGFVPVWQLRYRDLGGVYVGAVARAVEERRIGWLDATYMLDARVPTVEKMFEEYYRTGGRK